MTIPGAELPGIVAHAIRRTALGAGLYRRRSGRTGSSAHLYTPPGTLSVAHDALPPVVTVFAYGPDAYVERTVTSVAEIDALGS